MPDPAFADYRLNYGDVALVEINEPTYGMLDETLDRRRNSSSLACDPTFQHGRRLHRLPGRDGRVGETLPRNDLYRGQGIQTRTSARKENGYSGPTRRIHICGMRPPSQSGRSSRRKRRRNDRTSSINLPGIVNHARLAEAIRIKYKTGGLGPGHSAAR